MPVAAQPPEFHPADLEAQALPVASGSSARTRLEEAVGRELALRLISALSGSQGRRGGRPML